MTAAPMTAPKVMLYTVAFLLSTATAWAFDTPARSAMVLDVNTGTVLFEKDADRPIPPASMSKLMTLNLLFEAIKDNRVTMDTKFVVSQKAHKKGGSKMFLRQGERVSVENLINGIIIQSGNDACIVVAEGLAGSEAAFAVKMTERAKKLGMDNSHFANATGWPDPNQRMSANDLVFLANRLITEFPEYYHFFSKKSFTWSKVTQANRNPLLKLGIGADGLKTGHTEEAGYGLVGSAVQGGRRVILMITGLGSSAERASEAERITNWAFRNFITRTVFKKDVIIGRADVFLGQQDSVELYAKSNIEALIPYDAKDSLKAAIIYHGPLKAPISKDSQIAHLQVEAQGIKPFSVPLYAKSSIGKAGFFKRMKTSATVLSNDILGNSDVE